MVGADGSGLRRLFSGREWAFAPTWSPDGTRISFSGTPVRPPYINRWDLFTIRSDGTGLVHVAEDAEHNEGGSWAADGGRLVFPRKEPGVFDAVTKLIVVSADGGGETQLTSNYSPNLGPAWSP